jgi:hypothetical protein
MPQRIIEGKMGCGREQNRAFVGYCSEGDEGEVETSLIQYGHPLHCCHMHFSCWQTSCYHHCGYGAINWGNLGTGDIGRLFTKALFDQIQKNNLYLQGSFSNIMIHIIYT